jgi:hypothetical protein
VKQRVAGLAEESCSIVLADSLASKPAIYRWLAVVGDRPAVRRGMQDGSDTVEHGQLEARRGKQ